MTYIKDFVAWATKKNLLDQIQDTKIPYFDEREIWYCSMGHNVGYEQDGKGPEYWRPVLIVKKYNQHLFTGIPLTSKIKNFPFYFGIGNIDNKNAMAILSQTKAYSSKRLINKVEMLDKTIFNATKKAASEYIFGD
jgi:mRNA interferase MazF